MAFILIGSDKIKDMGCGGSSKMLLDTLVFMFIVLLGIGIELFIIGLLELILVVSWL